MMVPSKETFYLIAGSQIGEVVIESDEAKAVMKDITEIISHQAGKIKEVVE